MLTLFKSAIAQRIAGGFLVGAVAMLSLQPAESTLPVVQAVKAAAGIA